MRYVVNENCIGCGFFAATCPDVFVMTGNGVAKAVETEVAVEGTAAAEGAMDNCPVGAIEREKI